MNWPWYQGNYEMEWSTRVRGERCFVISDRKTYSLIFSNQHLQYYFYLYFVKNASETTCHWSSAGHFNSIVSKPNVYRKFYMEKNKSSDNDVSQMTSIFIVRDNVVHNNDKFNRKVHYILFNSINMDNHK